MKLAFVIACWLLAFFACTVLKWGVQPHIRAASEFCRGAKDGVLLCLWLRSEYDYWRSNWYDLGAAIVFACVSLVIIYGFFFSLGWALT